MNLLKHLTAKLDDNGHFLDPDGMLAMYTDHQHVHEVEHEPGTWYTDALMHTHDDAGHPVPKVNP